MPLASSKAFCALSMKRIPVPKHFSVSPARGAINSLMAELMDHIRNHMPRNSKSSETASGILDGGGAKLLGSEAKVC